jgi:hypothetical protein
MQRHMQITGVRRDGWKKQETSSVSIGSSNQMYASILASLPFRYLRFNAD